MFKILHTADWHLGRKLAGYDRTNEFETFFSFLENTIYQRMPDALIISGDIFDTGSPANETVKRYCALLVSLHSKFPDLQIVIIGGNHDSPSFLNIHAEILSYFSAIVVGGVEYIEGTIDYQKLIHPIIKNNNTVAIICSVPYLRTADLRRVGENSTIKDFYAQLYAQANLVRADKPIPIIATGHFTAQSASYPDNPFVGGIEGEEVDGFAPFSYIALGHIHRAQHCGNRDNIRYSGSPLSYTFSEINYPKSLTQVTFDNQSVQSIEKIEIPPTAELLVLPSTEGDIFQVQNACLALDANKDIYLAINIKQEYRTPETKSRIINEFLANKKAKFCNWHITKHLTNTSTEQIDPISATEFKNANPLDIISDLYRIKTSQNLEQKYIDMLKEIIEQE